MYDVGKIARGARRVYDIAPSPATFYTLVRGAIGATDELQREFAELPSQTQMRYSGWNNAAVNYRARLQQELLQAEVITDLVKGGGQDWQAAAAGAANYANALDRFFQGGDSAKWANLANQLAEVKAQRAQEGFNESFDRIVWLMSFWGSSWLHGVNQAADALGYDAGERLGAMAHQTRQAVSDQFQRASDFIAEKGLSIGLLIGVGLGIYFFGPAALAALGFGGKSE